MDQGSDIEEIGEGGRLLIWSWRRIARASPDCSLIAVRFAETCGEDAPEVLATLCTFLQALGYGSRRRLRVGAPCARAITLDERQLLNLIAAAVADDQPRLEALLRWLVRPEAHNIVTITARALAKVMAEHDLQVEASAYVRPRARWRPPAPRLVKLCDAVVVGLSSTAIARGMTTTGWAYLAGEATPSSPWKSRIT